MLNLALVLLYLGEHDFLVDIFGTLSAGVHKPDEEEQFDEEVEWNDSEDEASEFVSDREKTKHDPVSQPLFVIFFTLSLQCFEGLVAGVCGANKAGDVGVSNSKQNHHTPEN